MSMNRGQHEGHLPHEGAGCPHAGRTRPDVATAGDAFKLSEKKTACSMGMGQIECAPESPSL